MPACNCWLRSWIYSSVSTRLRFSIYGFPLLVSRLSCNAFRIWAAAAAPPLREQLPPFPPIPLSLLSVAVVAKIGSLSTSWFSLQCCASYCLRYANYRKDSNRCVHYRLQSLWQDDVWRLLNQSTLFDSIRFPLKLSSTHKVFTHTTKKTTNNKQLTHTHAHKYIYIFIWSICKRAKYNLIILIYLFWLTTTRKELISLIINKLSRNFNNARESV